MLHFRSQTFSMNRRILIVDDDEGVLETYRNILAPPERMTSRLKGIVGEEAPGVQRFDLVTVSQGEHAYYHVQNALHEGKPFAAAFVDMRMPPGWDGLLTATKLRELDERIYIVIVTAYTDRSVDEIQEALKRDALLVHKPFSREEMCQIARYLSLSWDRDTELAGYKRRLEAAISDRSQELDRSRHDAENILNGISDALLVISTDGRIQKVNPAASQLLGLPAPELVGQSLSRWVEGARIFSAYEMQALSGGKMLARLTRQMTIGERTTPVQLTGVAIRNGEGMLDGVACLVAR